jgi:hypothetical protein
MAEIITLSGTYRTTKELKEYCDAQYIALQGAVEKIKKLEEEITHLQQILATTTELISSPKVEKIIKTPELAICEAQIDILQNRALQKELTLEEVKILDLLIKNKRLLTGEATTIEGEKKKIKNQYSEAELVALAKKDNG